MRGSGLQLIAQSFDRARIVDPHALDGVCSGAARVAEHKIVDGAQDRVIVDACAFGTAAGNEPYHLMVIDARD